MPAESFTAVASIAIGAISLFSLLVLLRQRVPTLFAPQGRRLFKVIKTQHALGETLASNTARETRHALLPIISKASANRRRDGKLSLVKLIRYARWPISPLIFYIGCCGVSGIMLSLIGPYTNVVTKLFCLSSGLIIMRGALMSCVERRSNRFDADYPQFLMSMVGLLKTGLTPSGALEEAAQGLEPKSLVREEVLLMLERVKVGVLEDRSIGAFGEDILHPEIELFVQALLLSNRIGGNLSESLEQLSRQARKRQYFKAAAKSAVGLQQGSLFVISGILVSLQGYLLFIFPQLIMGGMKSEIGWHVWQGAFVAIIFAFIWVRRITKIKV